MAENSTEGPGRSEDLGPRAEDVDRYVIQVSEEHLTDSLMCVNRAATVSRRLLPDDLARSVGERLAEAKAALLDAITTIQAADR